MSLPEDKYRPKVPEGYFGKLDVELKHKLLDEEVFEEEEFPLLFALSKKEGFEIPKNYFESFEINAPRPKHTNTLKIILGLVASLLIGVSIFALSNKKQTELIDQVETEEVLRYFAEEEGIFYNEENTLEEFLSAEMYNSSEDRFSDIDEDILIDYLNEDTDQFDLAWLY